MTYQFIAEHQGMTPVKWMCQALGVSQSGYYAWKRRPPSRRSQEDHVLAERIEQISQASRRTYGWLYRSSRSTPRGKRLPLDTR